MCNRIRGLKEWSEIPRSLARSLINFEYNPNVAPTEQVPAFLAERGKPLATRMAVGINLASSVAISCVYRRNLIRLTSAANRAAVR